MRTPSRLAWGGAAALALLGAALWLSLGRRPARDRRPLAGVPAASLVRLERTLDGETLTLSLHAGRWRAGGKDAEPAACRALVDGARQLSLGAAVSEDPGAYESFGLSDQRAVRLKVFAEGAAAPALDAYFGKPAFGEALYARLAEETPVFVETGLGAAALTLPATAFLLKP